MKSTINWFGFLIVAYVAMVGVCSFGGTWQAVNGSWNGNFDDMTHWSGGFAANGGDNTIAVPATEDVTVTVAADAETTARLYLDGTDTHVATLDVTGHSILFATQTVESAVWPAQAFFARFNEKAVLQSNANDDRWKKQAQTKLSDVSVKVWSPEAGVAEMLVTGGAAGVFDFAHPDPRGDTKAPNGARPTVTAFGSDYFKPEKSSYNHGRLSFKDTTVYLPSFNVAGYPTASEIVLDGSTMNVIGTGLTFGSLTNLVVQKNGSTFVSNGAIAGQDGRLLRFTGGCVSPRGNPAITGAGNSRVEFTDAVLSHSNEVKIELAGTSVLSAEHAAFTNGTKFTVKTTDDAKLVLGHSDLCTPLMAGADGSSVELHSSSANVQNWGLSHARVLMEGCTFGDAGDFRFSGTDGSYVLTNLTGMTRVGATCSVEGSNVVTFTADSIGRTFIVQSNGHGTLGNGNGAYGELNIEGGTFEFRPENVASRFNLGHNNGTAKGVLNVKGGRFVSKVTTAGSASFGLGITHGTGFINVSGGEVDVCGLCICTESNASAPESCFRQTGGLVKVQASNYESSCTSHGLCATGNNKTDRKARIALDGGVTEANIVAGGPSGWCRSGTGWTAFEADGGTIRANAADAMILRDFDEAKIGAKGLTVDGNGYDLAIVQSIESKPSADGWLRLTGGGKKTISGANTVALVADGGEVAFAASADNSGVDLTATNGVTLSFATGGAKNRTFASLFLGDDETSAIVKLVAGEPLTVSGDVSIGRLVLVLSGSFTTGESYELLTCGGEVSEESKAAWAKAFAKGLGADQGCDFTAVNEGGRMVLKMSVRTRTVLELAAAADQTVDCGTNVLYGSADKLVADVGSRGTLNVTGEVGQGELEKTGNGRAIFDNGNDCFMGGVTVTSGLLAFPYASIFSDSLFNSVMLTVGTGTLQLGREGDPAVSVSAKLVLNTATASDPATVKCDSDVEMSAPTVTQGCFLKRGVGTLTLNASANCAFTSNAGKDKKGTAPSYVALAFDDFGIPPSDNYSSLTVAEGDLVLKGAANAKYTMTGNGAVYVGMPVMDISKRARLIVDGSTAAFNGAHFHVGSGVRTSNCLYPYAEFAVTNGGNATVTSLRLGWQAAQSGKPRVRVSGAASSLAVTEYLYLADSAFPNQDEDDPLLLIADGATLKLPSMLTDANVNHALCCNGGKAIGVFDGATLVASDGKQARITVSAADERLVFKNGSTCIVGEVRVNDDTSDLTMTFDNSEWSFGTLTTPTLTRQERIIVNARNDGVIFAPASDVTLTFPLSVSGTGGLVKRGEGDLILSAAPTFTGVCRIEEGALAFTQGIKASGICFAGAGMIRDSALEGAVIVADIKPDWRTGDVLTFKNVTFSGRTRVTIPEGLIVPDQLPKNIEIAHYEGTAPDMSQWKLIGVPKHAATFRAEGGKIYMDITPPLGLMLIVR